MLLPTHNIHRLTDEIMSEALKRTDETVKQLVAICRANDIGEAALPLVATTFWSHVNTALAKLEHTKLKERRQKMREHQDKMAALHRDRPDPMMLSSIGGGYGVAGMVGAGLAGQPFDDLEDDDE